jgi:hypothetical protein
MLHVACCVLYEGSWSTTTTRTSSSWQRGGTGRSNPSARLLCDVAYSEYPCAFRACCTETTCRASPIIVVHSALPAQPGRSQIILWPNAPESFEEEPYKNFGGRDYYQAQAGPPAESRNITALRAHVSTPGCGRRAGVKDG